MWACPRPNNGEYLTLNASAYLLFMPCNCVGRNVNGTVQPPAPPPQINKWESRNSGAADRGSDSQLTCNGPSRYDGHGGGPPRPPVLPLPSRSADFRVNGTSNGLPMPPPQPPSSSRSRAPRPPASPQDGASRPLPPPPGPPKMPPPSARHQSPRVSGNTAPPAPPSATLKPSSVHQQAPPPPLPSSAPVRSRHSQGLPPPPLPPYNRQPSDEGSGGRAKATAAPPPPVPNHAPPPLPTRGPPVQGAFQSAPPPPPARTVSQQPNAPPPPQRGPWSAPTGTIGRVPPAAATGTWSRNSSSQPGVPPPPPNRNTGMNYSFGMLVIAVLTELRPRCALVSWTQFLGICIGTLLVGWLIVAKCPGATFTTELLIGNHRATK